MRRRRVVRGQPVRLVVRAAPAASVVPRARVVLRAPVVAVVRQVPRAVWVLRVSAVRVATVAEAATAPPVRAVPRVRLRSVRVPMAPPVVRAWRVATAVAAATQESVGRGRRLELPGSPGAVARQETVAEGATGPVATTARTVRTRRPRVIRGLRVRPVARAAPAGPVERRAPPVRRELASVVSRAQLEQRACKATAATAATVAGVVQVRPAPPVMPEPQPSGRAARGTSVASARQAVTVAQAGTPGPAVPGRSPVLPV
jgi:hypothetical protein